MTDFNNIDDLFKESQKDWEKSPSNKTWEDLTNRLDEKSIQQTNSKKNLVRWLGAACIVGILGIGMIVFNKTFTYQSDMAAVDKVAIPAPQSTVNVRSLETEYFDSSISYIDGLGTVTPGNTSLNLDRKEYKGNSRTQQPIIQEKVELIADDVSSGLDADLIENSPALTYDVSAITNKNPSAPKANESYLDNDIADFKDEFKNKVPDNMRLEIADEEVGLEEVALSDLGSSSGDNQITDSLLLEDAYFPQTTVLANRRNVKYSKEQHQKAADSGELDDLYFSETAVQANYYNNIAKKEEHKKAADKLKRKDKDTEVSKTDELTEFDEKEVILPTHTRASGSNFAFDQAEHLEQKEKLDGSYDYFSKGALDDYYNRLDKKMTVKMPLFINSCDTLYLDISATEYSITKCDLSKTGFLFENNFLSTFYEQKINDLKSLEHQPTDKICTDYDDSKSITITVEYGQANDRFIETIIWNLDCPKYGVPNYYKKLQKLSDQLDKSKK